MWIEHNPVKSCKGTVKGNSDDNGVYVMRLLTTHTLIFFYTFMSIHLFYYREVQPKII